MRLDDDGTHAVTMQLWPPRTLQLQLRDECFEQLRRIPYARILELAPRLGAFTIPECGRVLKGGLWRLAVTGWGWRNGPDEVVLVVDTQVTWWMLPFRYTGPDRAIGFDESHIAYELTRGEIERLIP